MVVLICYELRTSMLDSHSVILYRLRKKERKFSQVGNVIFNLSFGLGLGI